MYNAAQVPLQYLYWEPVSALALVAFACVQALIVKWAVIGRVKAGTYKYPGGYSIRKWFADRHLDAMSPSFLPIYDSLFARYWCRALGMKCGPRCEIALPQRMPYDLVDLGEESFLASAVGIGRPIRRNGKVILERTSIGRRTFIGNDSVVPQGADIPDEFLLGVLSLCPTNEEMGDEAGQAWLGSPAFRMPTRQIHDQFDVRQTYRPTANLYAQRLAHESIRVFLPGLCSLIVAAVEVETFVEIWNDASFAGAALCTPLITCAGALVGTALVWFWKKVLIGRYKPTVQPLWSQFVWKTETYSAVLHDFAGTLLVQDIAGTPFLNAFMRLLGAKIGKRCFVNTRDFTETDLIHIGDDVAINSNAALQAHLFEDRVIKVGPIHIGDRSSVGVYSVVLCESELKSDVAVGHLSLVMKGETIPAGTTWVGSPAQAVPDADAPVRSLNGKA
jgi:non-ribosomal peptide synthetase-like protein